MAHATIDGVDDLGQPGRFQSAPEESISGYYGAALRASRSIVRWVPAGWPTPARRLVQIPLFVLAVVFVLVAWVFATLIALISAIGGGNSSARR